MGNNIRTDCIQKEIVSIPEEIPSKQLSKLNEGPKYQITVNAYERN